MPIPMDVLDYLNKTKEIALNSTWKKSFLEITVVDGNYKYRVLIENETDGWGSTEMSEVK